MTIFTMACFPGSAYSPLYLVIMCWVHIAIVCFIRCVLRKTFGSKEERWADIIRSSITGAIASVFINIKEDDKKEDEEEKSDDNREPLTNDDDTSKNLDQIYAEINSKSKGKFFEMLSNEE